MYLRTKLGFVFTLILSFFVLTPAQARSYHHYHHYAYHYRHTIPRVTAGAPPSGSNWFPQDHAWTDHQTSFNAAGAAYATNTRGSIVAHPAGCPARLFCGCGASVEIFGHSVRDLWLARNWLRFPRAEPAAGMAVVFGRGYHVAAIRQYLGNGMAELYDANSGGGQTRIHVVNISRLTVVDPHAGSMNFADSPKEPSLYRRRIRYAYR